VTRPAILLLDEPLSNLEAALRNQMRRELRRIQAETRQTIVYVTHDQIEALSLAHRIAVMHQGKLQQYDTAHETYHYPSNRFVGSFLGNPPMNFVEGTLTRENGRRILVHEGARLPLPAAATAAAPGDGAAVVAGLRAEAMTVAPPGHPDGFVVTVLVVEPQGAETILTVAFGNSVLKVVVPAGTSAVSDQRLTLLPQGERVALFDAASGVRLRPGGAAAS
jgi:multiple sugar transport system ATP-binding protein